MANRQTRRSISVKGETYERLRTWCEQHDRSMSGTCEQLVTEFLDSHEFPTISRDEALARQAERGDKPEPQPEPDNTRSEEIVSQHFTF